MPVFGPPELLRELDGEDVTAYLDLAGHGAGVYNLAVTIDPHRAFDDVTVEPTVVQVTVQ